MRNLLIVLALIGLGSAAWYGYERYLHETQPFKLYGNVDIREVNLGFRVPGKIARILHDEGDFVHAGDLLAEIDDEPYRWQVEQAKANLALLEADYRLRKAGYRHEEITQARATVAERQATVQTSERLYQRYKGLLQDNAISQQEYDSAQSGNEEAHQRLKAAQANLDQLLAGYRVEEVDRAKAQVEQAQASLAAAELSLADTHLTAPSDGTILTRAVEPGAIVQAGATVLALSLDRPVWVRAYVREPDLGKVPPGTKVELYSDSRPDHRYHGQVGFVSPRAEFTPKSVETPELRTSLVYRLRIVVEDPDSSLRQGMPVTVVLPSP